MIFVTVGGTNFDFSRLVREMDRISKNIDERVIIQSGGSKYVPKFAEHFRFKSREEIDNYYKKSRVVVAHAGMGTIITALKHKKPIIIVPRRGKYNELIDDHQMDVAKKLDQEGIGIVVYDVNDLEDALKNADKHKMKMVSERDTLVKNLKNYLATLDQSNK